MKSRHSSLHMKVYRNKTNQGSMDASMVVRACLEKLTIFDQKSYSLCFVLK